jgi:hypothetical protein
MSTTLDITAPPAPPVDRPADGDNRACIFFQVKNTNGSSIAANHLFPPHNVIGAVILHEAIRSNLAEAGIQPESLDISGEINAFLALIFVPRSKAVSAMAVLRGMLDRTFLASRSMIQWQVEGDSLFRIYHHGAELGMPEQLNYGGIIALMQCGRDRLDSLRELSESERRLAIAFAKLVEARAALAKVTPPPSSPDNPT